MKENDNTGKQEFGFTAVEQRALMAEFLAVAQLEVALDDDLQLCAFERTGCTLKLI